MKPSSTGNIVIKQILSAAGIIAIVMGLSSCRGLKSKHYVGEKLVISEEDLGHESIWMYEDEAYYVRRSESNTFIVATLQWNEEKGDYIAKSGILVPSKLGAHEFLNIKDNNLYTIFQAISDKKDSVVLLGVDRDKVVRDITDGIVCAHTNKYREIIMDGSKQEQDEYILNNIHTLFSMDYASFAKKLSEKKKAEEASSGQENSNSEAAK